MGTKKGGKISYEKIKDEFGIAEIKKRQSLGGKRAAKTKELEKLNNFKINIEDPFFLEFYGNLLGDGWLSNFTSGNKKSWIIGLSCNLSNERKLVEHYRSLVKNLFNRERKVRERFENNVIEFVFGHKILLKYLNKNLSFPIGKKENLSIHSSILSLGFEKVKYVLRGIFDTDGSFYLRRNRKGIPSYPIISIHMNEPLLIKQIGNILENEDFKIGYCNNGKMIRLLGRKQLNRWLNEIGSSNPYKLRKMQDARVTQPG